jgi:murein DD-endopeptidase MepM/ murein hydrolase activator NlpD
VLEYLKYGDDPQLEYYTVQAYDTVAGVGSKNHGLSATQVMNINRDKISSVDQLLKEGDELCVTYFTPPIDIIVEKDSLRQMPVYFETAYVEDSNLILGEREVRQNGINGARNVLYAERWINGVLVNGTEKSSVMIQEPQSEVIALGTQQLPDVGTGVYRFPVENPAISCGYGCYFGHEGTDIVNQYDRWGDVYAADTGVIETNAYQAINGNYVVINHNNGYKTYYGHMRELSELPEGTIVTKGQVIGHIGMTGLATGPHVHFMVQIGDKNVDACNGYLPCDTVPYQ